MVTKNSLKELIAQAVKAAGFEVDNSLIQAIAVDYPESKFGDYSTNAAMVLAKAVKKSPREVAELIIANIPTDYFKKLEIAGPGFINLFVKDDFLLAEAQTIAEQGIVKPTSHNPDKILLEYFQPNIAKPLHVGHLRTAIIGDALKRMMLYLGWKVESDTHLGDWGRQIGLLISKYHQMALVDKNHAEELLKDLNKLAESYVELSFAADEDPHVMINAKDEFVKLEQGDPENRRIWEEIVKTSMDQFITFDKTFEMLKFDHHWPESFYEDKMPLVVEELKAKGLLKESQGAQIVDLEEQKLGTAIILKSDGGTIYLLRDLATFLFRQAQGFTKQLYVVDSRQAHTFNQLFAILKLMGAMQGGEGQHIDYGFISFKGQALSTRKGNMILAEDVLREAKDRVAKIIAEKNPDLKNKDAAAEAIAKGALKYFDLSHNRHSDIEFDWDEALSFEGNSGPYLQYVYARLASILRKQAIPTDLIPADFMATDTERQIMVELTKFNDMVSDSLKDYLPNVFANYLYNLAGLANKFYHESPVIKEEDQLKKQFRLVLVAAIKNSFKQGLELLGITPLEEM